MSNDKKCTFYDDIIDNEAESKTFTYRGKEKTAFFRRINGAERITLLRGQKMQAGGDSKPSFTIDLAESAERNALLIAYSNVDAEGKPVFSGAEAVKKLPDDLITILYGFAAEVNKEVIEEAGKD